MNNDKLLLAAAEDKIRQCADRCMVTHTGFLDLHQQTILRRAYDKINPGCRLLFTGGFEEAERVVMICLPDYMEPDDPAVKEIFAVIRAENDRRSDASRSGRPPAHGDYLGALMGLGIRREMTGDILVCETGADIIVLADIAEYLLREFCQAGRARLSVSRHDLAELVVPRPERTVVRDTVASLRLDSIVASAFRLSRAKAAEAIRSGLIFVNNMETVKPDRLISEGDRITFRHKGRAEVSEIGRRTRKGRVNITLLR